jgi:hypothetical protein
VQLAKKVNFCWAFNFVLPSQILTFSTATKQHGQKFQTKNSCFQLCWHSLPRCSGVLWNRWGLWGDGRSLPWASTTAPWDS